MVSILGLRIDKLGRRFGIASVAGFVVRIPGPTDFLGARLETFTDDDGTWLWRRDLAEGGGGGGIDVFADVVCVCRRLTSLWRRIELDRVVLVVGASAPYDCLVGRASILLLLSYPAPP